MLTGALEEDDFDVDVLHLWDDKKGNVPNAVSYGHKEKEQQNQQEYSQESSPDLEEGYGTILEEEK